MTKVRSNKAYDVYREDDAAGPFQTTSKFEYMAFGTLIIRENVKFDIFEAFQTEKI